MLQSVTQYLHSFKDGKPEIFLSNTFPLTLTPSPSTPSSSRKKKSFNNYTSFHEEKKKSMFLCMLSVTVNWPSPIPLLSKTPQANHIAEDRLRASSSVPSVLASLYLQHTHTHTRTHVAAGQSRSNKLHLGHHGDHYDLTYKLCWCTLMYTSFVTYLPKGLNLSRR